MPKLVDNPHIRMALDDANELSAKLPLYPVSRSAAETYAGVNLKGKYSEIDLSFEKRLLNAEAAARSKPISVQIALDNLIQAAEPLKEAMIKSSSVFRQATLAEQFVDSPDALEEVKRQIVRRSEVQDYNKFIQAAELITGVTKARNANPAIEDFCQNTLQCPLDTDALQLGQSDTTAPPSRLDIHFEDLNPAVEFIHYTDENVMYALAHTNTDAIAPFEGHYTQEIDSYIASYSNATFSRELQYFDNFDKLELRSPSEEEKNRADYLVDPASSPFDPCPLDREDLISINGVSLREATNATIKANPDNIPDREAVRNSLLTEALIRGEQVECFMPDYQNKTISTKPVKMTLEGIEPKELKPPVMNGWQRYWSKRGYYKDLAAQMNKYETIQSNRQKMQERIERISKEVSKEWTRDSSRDKITNAVRYNKSRDKMLDTLGTDFYGPGYTKERSGVPDGRNFKLIRSGINLGICKMINDGYTIEEIASPEMKDARIKAGREIMSLARKDHPEDLARLVIPAMQKIIERPNLPIDYTNPAADRKNYAEISVRAAVFDLFQEATTTANKQAVQSIYGKAESSEFLAKAGNYGVFYRALEEYASLPDPNVILSNEMPASDLERISSAITMEQLLKDGGGRLAAGENPCDVCDLHTMDMMRTGAVGACIELSEEQQEKALEDTLSGKPIASLRSPLVMGEAADFQILAAAPVKEVAPPPMTMK